MASVRKSLGIVQGQAVSDEKKAFSRYLRKNQTPAEEMLWSHLRGKKCNGLKFRRQQVIDGFIVDFFCNSQKLVIEIDGSVHDSIEHKMLDEERTKVLEAHNLKVIRFTNAEVLENIEEVLETIKNIN